MVAIFEFAISTRLYDTYRRPVKLKGPHHGEVKVETKQEAQSRPKPQAVAQTARQAGAQTGATPQGDQATPVPAVEGAGRSPADPPGKAGQTGPEEAEAGHQGSWSRAEGRDGEGTTQTAEGSIARPGAPLPEGRGIDGAGQPAASRASSRHGWGCRRSVDVALRWPRRLGAREPGRRGDVGLRGLRARALRRLTIKGGSGDRAGTASAFPARPTPTLPYSPRPRSVSFTIAIT